MSDTPRSDTPNADKFRAALEKVGGWENSMVGIPAGAVRETIETMASIEGRLAAAQKDAERYRWARRQFTWERWFGNEIKWTIWIPMTEPNIDVDLTEETVPLQLDDAIDKAILADRPTRV